MTPESQKKESDHPTHLMRGPLRTIAVLRALNVRNGATVIELAKATGISRPALYRILETLREAGYVAVDLSRQQYCLTMLVRTLAEGFTDEDWVTQVARPVLRDLQRKVLWPVDLGTFMNDAMWIRETTRQVSPLTIDRGVVGLRFPLLAGATGRAYIAFCPQAEREQIVRNLKRSASAADPLIPSPLRLQEMIDEVRLLGYGHRAGEPPTETGAIAVPILVGERVVGCLNMTFIAAALSPQEAARQHLTSLNDAAKAIADGVQHLEQSVSGPGADNLLE